MNTKNLTKKYQKLLKNPNFLNAQNYVLGKDIIEQVNRAMNSSKNGKNVIGFQREYDFQEIDSEIIRREWKGIRWILLSVNLLFFGIITWTILENGFIPEILIMLPFFAPFTYLLFVPGNYKNYRFYRDRKNIIIHKIK